MSNEMNNREFAAKSQHFKDLCARARSKPVQPTKRQASKYRLGKGLAFRTQEGK